MSRERKELKRKSNCKVPCECKGKQTPSGLVTTIKKIFKRDNNNGRKKTV